MSEQTHELRAWPMRLWNPPATSQNPGISDHGNHHRRRVNGIAARGGLNTAPERRGAVRGGKYPCSGHTPRGIVAYAVNMGV